MKRKQWLKAKTIIISGFIPHNPQFTKTYLHRHTQPIKITLYDKTTISIVIYPVKNHC